MYFHSPARSGVTSDATLQEATSLADLLSVQKPGQNYGTETICDVVELLRLSAGFRKLMARDIFSEQTDECDDFVVCKASAPWKKKMMSATDINPSKAGEITVQKNAALSKGDDVLRNIRDRSSSVKVNMQIHGVSMLISKLRERFVVEGGSEQGSSKTSSNEHNEIDETTVGGDSSSAPRHTFQRSNVDQKVIRTVHSVNPLRRKPDPISIELEY